jgi:hypothetical protein
VPKGRDHDDPFDRLDGQHVGDREYVSDVGRVEAPAEDGELGPGPALFTHRLSRSLK